MTNWDDLFERIIGHGPSSETLFVVLSRMRESGQLQRVVRESVRALALFPDDIPIRLLLAKTYFDLGLLSQAEGEAEQVITRLENLSEAYKLQAHIYYRQKRHRESADALKVYLAHGEGDEDALRLLEALGLTQESVVPEEVGAKEVSIGVDEWHGGESGPRRGKADEESAVAAGEAFPEIASPTLAEIYFSQGQIPEAISTYESVLAQDPDDEGVRQRIAQLKTMLPTRPAAENRKRDGETERTERMIAVLEGWLAGIRKMSWNG